MIGRREIIRRTLALKPHLTDNDEAQRFVRNVVGYLGMYRQRGSHLDLGLAAYALADAEYSVGARRGVGSEADRWEACQRSVER
jgi:hypothetical protein